MPGLLEAKDPTYDAAGHRKPHATSQKATFVPVKVPDGPVWRDILRGRSDIVFFAERFMGVRLNRGQRRWARACALRADDGWRPAFLTTAVSAGNRAGKTLAMAVIIAHHCFYKLGLRPPNYSESDDLWRWIRAPYVWYHVSYRQSIARHVYHELVKLFAGDHPAQFDKETGKRRGCPLVDEIGKGVVSFDKPYEGEYEWIRFHPMFGGAEIHFRNTDEHAKGLLGLDMNGISFDEAAFELYLDTIRHQVLNLRRLSTGGPMHFISTPDEGHNDFYDLWEEGNPSNPERDPQVISLKMSSRDNIGYGLSQSEFDAIVRQLPEYLVPQNVDGEFIEAREAYFSAPAVEAIFQDALDEDVPPEPKHRYTQGVDPGINHDASWSITLDHTNQKRLVGVHAERKRGHQQVPAIVNMVRAVSLLYNEGDAYCVTSVDETGLGGKVFRQEFASAVRHIRGYDFAGTASKKLELLSFLKTCIDKGLIALPRKGTWLEVRRQLLGYKLADKKLTQDAVMALAIAVWFALRNIAAPSDKPVEFRFFGD